MSNSLATIPTFNIYAEPQTADSIYPAKPILVGEFSFNLDFLEQYLDFEHLDSSLPVVGLSTDVSKVNEGETLALDFELSNPAPAGGLTVELDLIEGSDSFAEGFVFLPEASSNIDNLELELDEFTADVVSAEVTFSEGATDASLVSEIVADNLTEGDETVSIGLVDGDAYDVDGDNDDVSFTIIDTSTSASSVSVVSLSTDVSKVNEGETLALDFELSDPAPAGGLTVELDLIEGSDSFAEGFVFLPEASSNIANLELELDEFTADVVSAEVTFSEGATDASLVSEIVADNLTEGDETVSIGLVDGDAYDVDSDNDDVNFTIIDTSTDLNSSSIEIKDLSVPFLGDVDFSIEIDYSSEAYDREPVSQTAIADSIDNYLMLELDEANSSELEIEDLAEFLATDSGLGISSISDSLTVELTIEPNSLIPDPITATSTFFTESIA